MPALQNVVLTDRATTPVNHTFSPQGKEGGVARLTESTGVPIADLMLEINPRKTAAGRWKVTVRFDFPTVQTETINGIAQPKVVYNDYATVDFSFSDKSTEQRRKDVVGMVQSALNTSNVLVNDTLVKCQGIYG